MYLMDLCRNSEGHWAKKSNAMKYIKLMESETLSSVANILNQFWNNLSTFERSSIPQNLVLMVVVVLV